MDSEENQRIKTQYDNIASIYDVVDLLIPDAWRRRATGFAYGRVLEVGVGTGLNLPYYLKHCQEIIGIDVSPRMLDRAREKAAQCKTPVKLEMMDIQDLPLSSGSFDCLIATFVFCTVPDPVKGLKECYRVLKPGGRLILLEHMGSDKKVLRRLMNWLNPIAVMLLGDHINRNTADLVTVAGFRTQIEEHLLWDIVRVIVADR
ncbi:MAG: class I SAM-dependent methyltransferase [Bacillota bacterium]